MPTSVTPHATSQSRSASSSTVVVRNVRTSWARPPCGSGVLMHAATVSLCTSSPAQRSTSTSMAPPLPSADRGRPEEPHIQRNLRFVLVATVLCSRGPHVRLTRGLDRTKVKPTFTGRPLGGSFHPLYAGRKGQSD